MKILMCDPPSGWKYGFPKPISKHNLGGEEFTGWLREHDYPEADLELAFKHSRFYEIEEDDINE